MPRAMDGAWDKYVTYFGLQLDGSLHYITAESLKENTGLEPRLLAKYDTPDQLPEVLRNAGYAILPVTNGKYVLFRGDVFADVPTCAERIDHRPSLEFALQTSGRGTGESQYIDNAHNTGILTHFIDAGPLYLTIRGRERSSAFDLKVNDTSPTIHIDGVQIEVDAGYEARDDIVIVEAKIGTRPSFNIRQLYFPYRHFRNIVPRKRTRTVYFEYDLFHATYTLHEFAFPDPGLLRSIVPVRCGVYRLVPEVKYRIDQLIDSALASDSDLVPQADDLNKVLEILTLVNGGETRSQSIAESLLFDQRQANYYAEAADYLGLLRRTRGDLELTPTGKQLLGLPPGEQQIFAAKVVINSSLFTNLLAKARRRGGWSPSDVEAIISTKQNRGGRQRYTSTTVVRRRQTIQAWASWLADEFGVFERDGESFALL